MTNCDQTALDLGTIENLKKCTFVVCHFKSGLSLVYHFISGLSFSSLGYEVLNSSYLSHVMRKLALAYVKNKLCRLIRTLVSQYLDRIMSLISKSEIFSFYIAPVATQPGLCQTWWKCQRLVFLQHGSFV